MDKIELLKNGIDFAKKNPNSTQALELRKRIESGMYTKELAQIKQQSQLGYVAPKEENIFEKIGNFTGGTKIAQGFAQMIANPTIEKNLNETKRLQDEAQMRIIEQMKVNKEQGKDNTNLIKALQSLAKDQQDLGNNTGKLLNQADLTPKQIIGDALQLATTVATIGGVSGPGAKATGVLGKVPGLTKQGTGIATNLASKIPVIGSGTGVLKGAAKGAIALGGEGLVSGASFGAAKGLKNDEDAMGILKSAGTGALVGGATGLVLGGAIGGISGGVKGQQLRKQVLDGQIQSGEKVLQSNSPLKEKAIQIAKQQGFDDNDIKFINSMKSVDKAKAQKMIDLAEKASVDKRFIERPIDVVGDSMVERIKFIQGKNSVAGKAVDETAKALKGQQVDATAIREKTLSLLENSGVTINKNGTLNWSKSIFNKTPELQSKIMKTLSDLPNGMTDGYDLHNFKKSIDEVVNYGVGGEGLKGKSASILKAIRTTADDILDSNFSDYNLANSDYKATRDILDITNDLFGKKAGIVKERGGQLLRSVFSNNAQRPRVMALVEQLDKIAKNYGGKFKDNLLDQTLFTEILEDIYGTQATTSLQGQVARAVQGTQKVIAGLRDPIKGAGELIATTAEKIAGVSDENKRKILKSLLK